LKTCDACHRLFPDDGGFCPIDGNRLASLTEASLPSDPEDPRVGASICGGRYQIWRRIADGGMGRVYQALDKKEGRSVALKILHPEVALDEVSVERFKREFECSSALPHEHIVEVFAFEETEDQSFALVMEYLEGEELRAMLKRDKVLPPERVIRVLSQVAMGLAAAHERKIVHRDLKPDNVFLCGTREGDHTKILDFGSVRDNSEGAKKLTVMGTTIGSPYYMAPEQAQASPTLDHRADVWSLAAIAYECLTGKVPFQGTTGPAILLTILTRDPKPPSEAGAAHDVPRTLDAVMEEALAKNPEHRPPSVGALVDRIGEAYGLEGTHAEWAKMSQDELGARIHKGLPAAMERHATRGPAAADMSAMDAAFRAEDPFKVDTRGDAGFAEDMVMGVPAGPPRWLVPVIAGAAVLIGLVVVFLIVR